MILSLVDMKPGEKGSVLEIEGGSEASRRIQNMGVRIGKEIQKERGSPRKGPQTVLVGRLKVAIGFGMASKIRIKVER